MDLDALIVPKKTYDSLPVWDYNGRKLKVFGGNLMRGYSSRLLSRHLAIILTGLVLAALSGFYFFNVSAHTQNAESPNTIVISGRITRVGASLGSVTVNLSGTTNAATTTDNNGNYQFSGLPEGGNYVVSPSLPNHFFTPPNRSFNNLSTNQIGDHTAAEICIGRNCAKNGKIAFVVGGGGVYNIFTMNPDGSGQSNITNNATNTLDAPDFAPDGTKIAFTSNRDGNREIYRMDADGSNPLRLTNNAAADKTPYYSPDGASILFVSNRDGNDEIYKMNADGSNPVRLTSNSAADLYPAFSPDAAKIIFVTNRTGGERLFTMNADGSNQQIFSDVAGSYARPSYSPDGHRIIFAHGPIQGVPEAKSIWLIDADGCCRTQLASGGNAALDPTWSPDGYLYAYQCCNQFPKPPGTPDTLNGIYATHRITSSMGHFAPDWQPLTTPRRTASDFDGDGRSDISVFRPTQGVWYLFRSTAGFAGHQWGLSTDVLAPADYDGDLKTDIAVWRGSDSNFYVLNSFDSTVRVEPFGIAGDVPTGGDWDGDGKADVAVYRPGAQSVFYYRGSMGNPQGNVTFIPWGLTGDKPVVGDYDGDGRTDAAIYRSGTWYVRRSSNGQFLGANFGLPDDVLVPADYDGDGKTDFAVFRSGTWYLLRSTGGSLAFQFGIASDIPAPADYDGDGRADAAVFRNGDWWIQRSQSGATEVVQWGVSLDKPIPSAFVR